MLMLHLEVLAHCVIAHSLNWYRFIGRILGKALYEGILVDVAFAGFFLAKVSFNVQGEGPLSDDDCSGWENRAFWMTYHRWIQSCTRA